MSCLRKRIKLIWPPPTRRQLRLCERNGHRWGAWIWYSSSVTVLCGSGVDSRESGKCRYCRRCQDRQYLDVEMEQHEVRDVGLIAWSEPMDDWSQDPDAWKEPR